jgi:predicted nuclease with RNAse H fold
MIKYFVGIDVQINRGCCYYILDENKNYISSGWEKEKIPQAFKNLLLKIKDKKPDSFAIGIDAPRMPLKKLRTRYFDKKENTWVEKSKKSNGRECEVVIKSYNIANPQWTKFYADCPDWMKLGFEIFSELKEFPFVYEVFPSASYKMLEKERITYQMCLNSFSNGVKDMFDASVAALTVYEFVNGRGCEVGGEDGLGTIVLPRKIRL